MFKKEKKSKIPLLVSLLFFSALFGRPTIANSQIPFMDNFESSSLKSAWTVSGGSTNIVSGFSAEGNRSLAISDSAARLSVTNSVLGSNVWIRFYLWPAPCDHTIGALLPSTNDVAGFYVNSTGVLMAIDYDGYKPVITTDPIPTNQWVGFAVHLDYGLKKWELYMTKDPYGVPLNRITSNLGFYTGAVYNTSLSYVMFDSTGTGFVDAVAVATDDHNLEDLWDAVVVVDLPAKKSFLRVPPPYLYSGTNSTLQGQLGVDLKKGLVPNDIVRVLSSNGWKEATLDASDWQGDVNEVIFHGQNFWSDRRSVSNDSAVAYPYNPSNAPANSAQVIYGTNNPSRAGWNNIMWPLSLEARAQNEGNGWHFGTNAANDDKIWIYENNAYTVLKYIQSSNHWSRIGTRSMSDKKLIPGQPFWYQRRVGTDFVWNPVD